MSVYALDFGTTATGMPVHLYRLKNNAGMEVDITDIGASIVAVRVPRADGSLVDVALGFDEPCFYESNKYALGGVVGRCANRIAGAAFTLDGKPVCLHDGSIDRTSSGSGMATDMTLDALRQYDFGAWKGPEFAGTKIPTFEEFLTLCRNLGLHPYIELKAHDNATEERIASLVETVRAYGMEDKVTWISFSYQLLAVVHNCSPNARLGYLVTEVNYQNVSEARWLQNGTNEVFMNSASYSDAECRLCAENGLPLEVWTLDTEEEILALNPYISGVTSDCLHAGKVLETAYLSR